MKILYFKCSQNTHKCILEVELEGEKIAISFRKQMRLYDSPAQYGSGLGRGNSYQNPPPVPTPEQEYEMDLEQAKRELSDYLVERLFREKEAMKAIKK